MLDRHRSPAIIAPGLCFIHRVDSFVERGFEVSFLEMCLDSVSIPSLADYSYAPCVGVL